MAIGRLILVSVVFAALVFPMRVMADTGPVLWAEGGRKGADGATYKYYNKGGKLRWGRPGGDWVDAEGVRRGKVPLAKTTLRKGDRFIALDVTGAVKDWAAGRVPNRGFLLRSLGGAPVAFHSREVKAKRQRPVLVLDTDRGNVFVDAAADTWLAKSTSKSLGKDVKLNLAGGRNVLIYFKLDDSLREHEIRAANLMLYPKKVFSGGRPVIGAFHCFTSDGQRKPATVGVAADFRSDKGIAGHPKVLFFEDFEQGDWEDNWSIVNQKTRHSRERLEAGFGQSLHVVIPANGNLGLDLRYRFQDRLGYEPEAIFMRYYFRIGEGWRPRQNGKLPGIAGTYDRAGWGGRRSDGANGWSMRGLYEVSPGKGNPAAGKVPVGFYAYHADQAGIWGDHWHWTRDGLGLLQPGRWYSIEQYVKLNTPGLKDGEIRAWVDGRLAFERTGARIRTTDRLKIQEIWMNVYHGGTGKPGKDLHLYIDNIVVSDAYIGPRTSP